MEISRTSLKLNYFDTSIIRDPKYIKMSWIGGNSNQAQTQETGLKPEEQLNTVELKSKIDGFVSQNPQSLYLIDGYVLPKRYNPEPI